jgi:hypothetical protein
MALRKRRAQQADKQEHHGKRKALAEDQCMVCGKHANQRATVYLGRQTNSGQGATSIEWQPYTRALCPACVEQELDSTRFGTLVYLVLQVCWVPLATHGPSALGIGGALVAGYGAYRLVQTFGRWLWRRHHPEGTLIPTWLGHEETAEERASRALAGLIREDTTSSTLALETIDEHHRKEA